MLTQEQYKLFLQYIKPYMVVDEYGLHTICNIYYDTDNYDLIRRSIEKPKYKEKLCLRSYGKPRKKDAIFVEFKKKYDGTVFKRRSSLTLEEAERYLNNVIKPKGENQILKEIDYFLDFYKRSPKLYIAYDRIAYFGREDKEIRITVDHNIRYSHYQKFIQSLFGNMGAFTKKVFQSIGEVSFTISDVSIYLSESGVTTNKGGFNPGGGGTPPNGGGTPPINGEKPQRGEK